MRDALLDFGKITAFAASSGETYCDNVLDLGARNADDTQVLTASCFGSDTPAVVVFTATAPVTGFTPKVYSGATSSPTEVYGCGPRVAAMAAGDTVKIPVPIKCARYLRAGGTATATSGAVTAHIELGGCEE